MDFYNKHKTPIRIIGAIVCIIILLLLLKTCTNNSALPAQGDNSKPITTQIEKVKKNPKKKVNSKDNYEKEITVILTETESVEDNFIDFIDVVDPFVCDEDTANVYREFGMTFQEHAYRYFEMKYMGDEVYSDQEYFDKQFDYYTQFGEILIEMGNSMDDKNTDAVIEGFNQLEILIESMDKGEL